MENQKQTSFKFEIDKHMSFKFEIDNFWKKVDVIRSPIFLSGGCEWFLELYPKGRNVEDHSLSVYLYVANPETLRLGWKRRATFSFILLNHSGKELGRTAELYMLFCAYIKNCGTLRALPLKKLQEKGSLENGKLIVKVEIQVHEAVDEGGITGTEMVDAWGFRVLVSQAFPVFRLFEKHPDTAANFRQRSQLVRTAFMNLLLGLIETLNKPPQSFTDAELSNARIELMDLTRAGFKVFWLKRKLDEISLERKKANAHVQEPVDENIKVELKTKLNEVSMERKKANAHVQEPDDEHMIKVELKTKLVRSWNEWKVRLGYSHHVGYEKINLMTPFL